jgi:hypothetical protein
MLQMGFSIKAMTIVQYAEMQRMSGAAVILRHGTYWRRVRPFFYRPILPLEAHRADGQPRPFPWPNGYQHVVTAGEPSNSTLNFIVLDNLQSYSLGTLSHRRRHLITHAGQSFEVRPITASGELKQQGHRVYLSFFRRTKYSYKSERQQKVIFDQWADALFRHPAMLVLGGYGGDGLVAISTSCLVNTTLVYSTLICETAAMKKNVGEVMFHELRRIAANQPEISRIYVRNYQGGGSHDQYYLMRGCRLERIPALLDLPTPARTLIPRFLPKQYARLCGEL